MARSREINDKRTKAANAVAERVGWTLMVADRRFEASADQGLEIVSLRVRCPTEEKDDYMVVVKARGESGNIIGFGGGLTFAEAVASTLERLFNGSIKWKEDEYVN